MFCLSGDAFQMMFSLSRLDSEFGTQIVFLIAETIRSPTVLTLNTLFLFRTLLIRHSFQALTLNKLFDHH